MDDRGGNSMSVSAVDFARHRSGGNRVSEVIASQLFTHGNLAVLTVAADFISSAPESVFRECLHETSRLAFY